MLSPEFLRSTFEVGLPYAAYVATGRPDQQQSWARAHAAVRISPEQRGVVEGFVRRMPVLVTSGTWCGDCVMQVPILDHLARCNPGCIDLRMVDRDRHADLAAAVRICGGLRVPTVIFMSEDFEFMAIEGDKTLSRLRSMAAKQLGNACPLPGADQPADELSATVEDWVTKFEHVHLLLRMSHKLRERHGD